MSAKHDARFQTLHVRPAHMKVLSSPLALFFHMSFNQVTTLTILTEEQSYA